jgi:hypothetical protein
MTNTKKKKQHWYFGRVQNGIYFTLPYITAIIAISIIGILSFEIWFFLVLGTTAFIVADTYFCTIIDYETDSVYLPVFKKTTENEYVVFITYLIGVSIAGLSAYLSSFFLNLFKAQIHNYIFIPIISVIIVTLIAYEIKSGMSKETSPQQTELKP